MSTVNYTFTDFAKKIAYVVTRFCGTSIIKKMVIGVQVVTASQIIRYRWQAISSCPCITDHVACVCSYNYTRDHGIRSRVHNPALTKKHSHCM